MYSDMANRGYAAPGRTATLFGQTMGLVALTAGFFAAGAYAGRNLSEGALTDHLYWAETHAVQ